VSKPTFLEPLIGLGASQAELINADGGSVLATRVEPAFDSKARKQGLLGRAPIPEDFALIIAPCSAVHTIGMRTPIDIVFVTRNGTVTRTQRGVKPWRLSASLRAFAVVEAAPGWIDRHAIVPGETLALRSTQPAPGPAAPPAQTQPSPRAGATPARHHTTRRRVALAEVVRRKTPAAWFESVAVTQELIATVLAAGHATDVRVPELKHIALSPDGAVELLADGPAWPPSVHRAGLVLLALTPEEQLPLQLRLLVLEEVAPRPRLTSLAEFHRELAFYERPDRRAIVRTLYERFVNLGDTEGQAVVPAPLLEPQAPRRRVLPAALTPRRLAIAASVALVAASLLWAAWEWRRPRGQWLRDGTAAASTATAGAVRKAREVAGSSFESARRFVGLQARLPETRLPSASGTVPSAEAGSASGAPPLVGRPLGATAPGGTGGEVVPQAGLASVPDSGVWKALGWVPGSPIEPLASETDPLSPAPIYSSAVQTVQGPDLVSPKLRKGLPAGVRVEDLPEVEIVVSATGEVESARFVSPMRGVKAAVMLSAVKAWQFQPATQEGKPVRYRLRIRLVG
jgi:hypothetical protein